MLKKTLITFDTLLVLTFIIVVGVGLNNRCEDVSIYMYCDKDD